MEPKETPKNVHHGHAIKRFRHALGIKQDALASEMGISQGVVSTYEQKPVIEDEMIERFAKALNVAPVFIKELEEDPVTIIIENNTFDKGNAVGNNDTGNNNIETLNIDPVDKIIELANEKAALYERIIEVEREKTELLEKLMKDKR